MGTFASLMAFRLQLEFSAVDVVGCLGSLETKMVRIRRHTRSWMSPADRLIIRILVTDRLGGAWVRYSQFYLLVTGSLPFIVR